MTDSSGTSPPGLMVLVPTITIARILGELREELERAGEQQGVTVAGGRGQTPTEETEAAEKEDTDTDEIK